MRRKQLSFSLHGKNTCGKVSCGHCFGWKRLAGLVWFCLQFWRWFVQWCPFASKFLQDSPEISLEVSAGIVCQESSLESVSSLGFTGPDKMFWKFPVISHCRSETCNQITVALMINLVDMSPLQVICTYTSSGTIYQAFMFTTCCAQTQRKFLNTHLLTTVRH